MDDVDVDATVGELLAPEVTPALAVGDVERLGDDNAERRYEDDFELPASLIIRAGTSKMSKIGGIEGTSTVAAAAIVAAPRLVCMRRRLRGEGVITRDRTEERHELEMKGDNAIRCAMVRKSRRMTKERGVREV